MSARLRAGIDEGEDRLSLFWDLGRMMLLRWREGDWPRVADETLAADLGRDFPERWDLTVRNLRAMEAFTRTWPNGDYVPGPRGELSWAHQILMVENLFDSDLRRWYAAQAIEGQWSASSLAFMISVRCDEPDDQRNPNFG